MDPQPNPPTPGSPDPQAPQPVAYDQYGRPLYAYPPTQPVQHPVPQIVQVTRPIDPIDPAVSPEVMQHHEASRSQYPQLNLSRGEYVISAVQRHSIGLLKIWFIAIVLMIALGGLVFFFLLGDNTAGGTIMVDQGQLATVGTALMAAVFVMIILGAMVATYVYKSNRFYLTNESVIQEIQTTPFSKYEQTVSLINIEDASYKQGGILPTLLNYGTIRLSTEGDETTYRFSYVSNPKRQIALLNNAVEAFKNGRPVSANEVE